MAVLSSFNAFFRYEWRFNGEKLNAREKEARFDPNTGSLFIGEYFNEQLTGDYQCIVSNEYGTSMTPYLRIAATGWLDLCPYLQIFLILLMFL